MGEDHLKMALRMADTKGPTFDAIGFRLGGFFELVKSGTPFSVLYTLEENEWNGRRTLQLNIKDIKPAVDSLLESEPELVAEVASLGT